MDLRKAITVAVLLVSPMAYGQQTPKLSENLSALEFLVGEWTIAIDARLSKKRTVGTKHRAIVNQKSS